MFDVGFTEVLLIGVVALVVIGPERLPAVAKTVGQWIGKLQRFVKGVKTDLASELESGDLKKLIGDQREQIDELRQMVSTAKKDFQTTTRSVVETTRESLAELETTVNDAKEEITKVAEDADASPSDSPSNELSEAQSVDKVNAKAGAVIDARASDQSDLSLTKPADEQAKRDGLTTPSTSTAPSTKPLRVPMEPLLKPEPTPARTDSRDSDK